MSLKQYNWTDGEVITAEKLNRGGVTIVGATTEETDVGKMRTTLDMTLQEIYDAMGKGIVVLIMDQQDEDTPSITHRTVFICTGGYLAIPEQKGALKFLSLSGGTIAFQCATNDSFPWFEHFDLHNGGKRQ